MIIVHSMIVCRAQHLAPTPKVKVKQFSQTMSVRQSRCHPEWCVYMYILQG